MLKNVGRTRLLTKVEEQPNQDIIKTKENERSNNLAIDQEIECPRYQVATVFCSDVHKVSNVCEECEFVLYLN